MLAVACCLQMSENMGAEEVLRVLSRELALVSQKVSENTLCHLHSNQPVGTE